ncbi:FkbM family methyltransferase [Patescibacteria group bacterium]|nr:FkbM family methyltransferase [Patescibacteria group bacterium]
MTLKDIAKALLPAGARLKIRQLVGAKDSLDATYVYPDSWISQRKFYGQYGEDLKLLPLFAGEKDGYFVEVGALEGIRFSNTYYFERLGWRGVCVEPHPDYIDLLKSNRPGSTVIQAAVGKEDKAEVDFYTNYRGSLSTLDPQLSSYFKNHYGSGFGGFKTVKVPLLSLNSILNQYQAPCPIDIISIDVEGTERDVLDGFDIDKYAPRVVVVEVSIKREAIDEYMAKHNYILACSNPSNAIFCRSAADANLVRETNVVGTSHSPKHPLDDSHE